MNDVLLTRDALLLEALNLVCQKARLKPSALLLLNFPFTDAELQTLDHFLNRCIFDHQALSAHDVAQKLHEIRPIMAAVDYHFLAADLIKAWQREDRYHGLVFE